MICVKVIAKKCSLMSGWGEEAEMDDLYQARRDAESILKQANGEFLGGAGTTTTWNVPENKLQFLCKKLAEFNSVVMDGSPIVLTPEFYC